jgi:hypothetical protein
MFRSVVSIFFRYPARAESTFAISSHVPGASFQILVDLPEFDNGNCMLCGKNIYDGMGRDVISKGFLR